MGAALTSLEELPMMAEHSSRRAKQDTQLFAASMPQEHLVFVLCLLKTP